MDIRTIFSINTFLKTLENFISLSEWIIEKSKRIYTDIYNKSPDTKDPNYVNIKTAVVKYLIELINKDISNNFDYKKEYIYDFFQGIPNDIKEKINEKLKDYKDYDKISQETVMGYLRVKNEKKVNDFWSKFRNDYDSGNIEQDVNRYIEANREELQKLLSYFVVFAPYLLTGESINSIYNSLDKFEESIDKTFSKGQKTGTGKKTYQPSNLSKEEGLSTPYDKNLTQAEADVKPGIQDIPVKKVSAEKAEKTSEETGEDNGESFVDKRSQKTDEKEKSPPESSKTKGTTESEAARSKRTQKLELSEDIQREILRQEAEMTKKQKAIERYAAIPYAEYFFSKKYKQKLGSSAREKKSEDEILDIYYTQSENKKDIEGDKDIKEIEDILDRIEKMVRNKALDLDFDSGAGAFGKKPARTSSAVYKTTQTPNEVGASASAQSSVTSTAASMMSGSSIPSYSAGSQTGHITHGNLQGQVPNLPANMQQKTQTSNPVIQNAQKIANLLANQSTQNQNMQNQINSIQNTQNSLINYQINMQKQISAIKNSNKIIVSRVDNNQNIINGIDSAINQISSNKSNRGIISNIGKIQKRISNNFIKKKKTRKFVSRLTSILPRRKGSGALLKAKKKLDININKKLQKLEEKDILDKKNFIRSAGNFNKEVSKAAGNIAKNVGKKPELNNLLRRSVSQLGRLSKVGLRLAKAATIVGLIIDIVIDILMLAFEVYRFYKALFPEVKQYVEDQKDAEFKEKLLKEYAESTSGLGDQAAARTEKIIISNIRGETGRQNLGEFIYGQQTSKIPASVSPRAATVNAPLRLSAGEYIDSIRQRQGAELEMQRRTQIEYTKVIEDNIKLQEYFLSLQKEIINNTLTGYNMQSAVQTSSVNTAIYETQLQTAGVIAKLQSLKRTKPQPTPP